MLLVIQSLQERGLIKSMEYNAYTRIHHEDKEIKVVKQMPTIASNKQPTIAIITAQYCEKLAVDAMLENKETFVRYTTVGRWRHWQKCLVLATECVNSLFSLSHLSPSRSFYRCSFVLLLLRFTKHLHDQKKKKKRMLNAFAYCLLAPPLPPATGTAKLLIN